MTQSSTAAVLASSSSEEIVVESSSSGPAQPDDVNLNGASTGASYVLPAIATIASAVLAVAVM